MFLAAELPRPVRAMDDAARSLRTSSAIGRHDVPPCRERLRASAAGALSRALYWHSIRATNGQVRGKNGHSPVIEKRRNPHVSGDRKRWYSAVSQGCNPLLAHIELERINVFQTPVAGKHFAISWIKGHLMVTSFCLQG